MAATKSITLVTGANGGIGYELVKQLLSDSSKHVLLGSRSVQKGEAALKELQSQKLPGTVELLQIDVSSEDSIIAAAKKVESNHGRLDALVNNAAIAIAPGNTGQQLEACFRTNAIGPWWTVEHFAPLLRKCTGGTPRIINVSSGAGIIAKRLDPSSPTYSIKGEPYRASKSALNMLNACQAVEYGGDGFKVFAYCPGFTVSNLGPHNRAENGAKPTSEGTAPMVRILNGERDAEHGMFLNLDGLYDTW